MRARFVLLSLIFAAACGDDSNGANNGTSNGATDTGTEDASTPDAGGDDELDAEMPEQPAVNTATGTVGSRAIAIDGFALATVTMDGTLTLLMSDADIACDNATVTPGDVYLEVLVDPDDDVFEAKTYITSKATIEGAVTEAPAACEGAPITLAKNDGLLPRSITFTEVTDDVVAGHFEIEMYDGLEEGLVTSEFRATRCGSALLPMCQP